MFVLDANVLIDLARADASVLGLLVRHVGLIVVPRDVLVEVVQLDEEACARLNMRIVDGSLEQLAEAAAKGGGLSFADRVCLILARDSGWICVSNDGRLRRACGEAGVEVRWGFELLLALVSAGGMDSDSAIELVEEIASMNPWIGRGVVENFKRKVRNL